MSPEAEIDSMHKTMANEWSRAKILAREESHVRAVIRRNLAISQRGKVKQEEDVRQALLRLENLGWLEMMVLRTPTTEEITFFENTMNRYQPPYRDLDSSVGITIYPDKLSWLLDVYGGEHLFLKSKQGKTR